MISRALNALGLMTVSEHERIVDELDQVTYSQWRNAQTDLDKMDAKFKLAATDLAKQAEEIANYRQLMERADHQLDQSGEMLDEARAEIDALRHDANMWRNSLKRSRDRKKGVGRG